MRMFLGLLLVRLQLQIIVFQISNWPSLIDQVASFSRMLIQFKTDDRSTINVRLVYGEKNQSEAERLTAEK